MAINRANNGSESVERVMNNSFDKELQLNLVEPVGFDGVSAQRLNADNMAVKVTTVGTITYLGLASPGTAQSTAKWQARKIDTTDGVSVTWADGNANFDNTSTDLTALTYT